MKRCLLIAVLVGLAGIASAQHVLVQEDFEGYTSIDGIDTLPAAGTKQALLGPEVAALNDNDHWMPIPDLPEDALFSAPNNFSTDFYIANGVDDLNTPLAGLTGTTSFGLKNLASLTYCLGSGLGTVSVSFDIATANHTHAGQPFKYALVARSAGQSNLDDGVWELVTTNDTILAEGTWGVKNATTNLTLNADTTAAGSTNIYLVLQHTSYGRSTHIDNISVESSVAPATDTTKPTPDPMVLVSASELGPNTVELVATNAVDDTDDLVAYYFTSTAGGGNDSGWTFSNTYTDSGLTADSAYSYSVMARDLSGNTTAASATLSATTTPSYVIMQEDFETYDSIDGITALPNSGESFAMADKLCSLDTSGPVDRGGGRWDFLYGLPNNIICSSSDNAWESDAWLGNALNSNGETLGGTNHTVSLGIKNRINVAFPLGSQRGIVGFSFDVFSSGVSTDNLQYRLVYGDPVSGTVLFSGVWDDQDTAVGTNVVQVGIDTAAAGTELLYLVFYDHGFGRSVHIDNIEVTSSIAPVADVTAPSPDPMELISVTPLDPNTITMVATNATDESDVVYYFTSTAGGGNDSGWIRSNTYTDTGLTPGGQYTYTVMARDLSANANTTAASAPIQVTTPDPDVVAPSPNPMTFLTAGATSDTEIELIATTATDDNPVEYSFTAVSGGGNDSGWQSSPVYVDTGLSPETEYGYTVMARDLSPQTNVTAVSGTQLVKTRRSVSQSTVLTEDFESHIDWTTLGNGSLPATNTHTGVSNTVADVRGSTLFNGWNFVNAGTGADWVGDIALVNNTSGVGAYSPDNTGSVSLMLKNWTMVYKEVSVGDAVTLNFDYYFSSVVTGNGSDDLLFGIFDEAPTNDGRNNWETSGGTVYSITPAGSQDKGSISQKINLAGTSGTVFIGFFKENWNGAVAIDNIELLESDPSYYAWIDGHESLPYADRVADLDPDGDGLANLYEYAVGGNATNAADTGIEPILSEAAGSVEYAYPVLIADPSLSYTVLVTDDLTVPSWGPIGVAPVASGSITNGFEWYTTTVAPADVEFYQLEVQW